MDLTRILIQLYHSFREVTYSSFPVRFIFLNSIPVSKAPLGLTQPKLAPYFFAEHAFIKKLSVSKQNQFRSCGLQKAAMTDLVVS